MGSAIGNLEGAVSANLQVVEAAGVVLVALLVLFLVLSMGRRGEYREMEDAEKSKKPGYEDKEGLVSVMVILIVACMAVVFIYALFGASALSSNQIRLGQTLGTPSGKEASAAFQTQLNASQEEYIPASQLNGSVLSNYYVQGKRFVGFVQNYTDAGGGSAGSLFLSLYAIEGQGSDLRQYYGQLPGAGMQSGAYGTASFVYNSAYAAGYLGSGSTYFWIKVNGTAGSSQMQLFVHDIVDANS